MLRPRLLTAIALGLLVGLIGVALLARSSGSSKSASPRTPSTRPSSPGSSVVPGTSDPSVASLVTLVVKQADVDPSMTVSVLVGGIGLDVATLDLCNAKFPSDTRRTARLQDAVVSGTGQVVLSTEAVLYPDSAATTQAFTELRTAAVACPSTPVPGAAGEPPLITRLRAAPDAAWPQTPTVNRLAYDFTADDGSGAPRHIIAVYLRRGRALLGVYFLAPDSPPPAVTGQNTVAGIVSVFADRLAALPTSVVGS